MWVPDVVLKWMGAISISDGVFTKQADLVQSLYHFPCLLHLPSTQIKMLKILTSSQSSTCFYIIHLTALPLIGESLWWEWWMSTKISFSLWTWSTFFSQNSACEKKMWKTLSWPAWIFFTRFCEQALTPLFTPATLCANFCFFADLSGENVCGR